MNLHPLITQRYSPRAFADKPVSDDDLLALFEAAHKAPSARNEQPWRFYYAQTTDGKTPNPLLPTLTEWNQKWAQSAPVLVAAVAKLNYDYKNTPNTHAIYDLGQAVAWLTVQATALNLFVHQMGGFSRELAGQLIKLEEGYEIITILAIGYKGDLDRIPPEYHADELQRRDRKSLDSIAFKAF